MDELNLPEIIKVKIGKCKHNKFIVELPDYDVHTEINHESELLNMVNDLIYSLFEIPKNLQNQILYKPKNDDEDFDKAKPYIMMSTPEVFRKYYCS